MSINLLASNRATFEIAGFDKFIASVTGFELPSVSLPEIETPTRFNPGKESGTTVRYENLEIEFLIDEDLSNWLEIYNWIISLGMPEGHSQYRGHSDRNSDGNLTIYSSHNNIELQFKFYDMFPVSLTGIQFTEEDSDTVYRKATASFAFLYYEPVR